MDRNCAVRLIDVRVNYGQVLALDGVDLSVDRGQALGIVGPNGSGKSTLLKVVAGLVAPARGVVEVFGRRPRELPAGTIAYVPQVEAVDWSFPASVYDVVAMGRFPKLKTLARFGAPDREAVDRALSALRLDDLRSRHISQLSGGQQQRTFVARAIAQEPELLLLDEPTTGVDAATEEALLHIVRGTANVTITAAAASSLTVTPTTTGPTTAGVAQLVTVTGVDAGTEESLRVLVRELVGGGMPVIMTTHDLDRAPEWFDRLAVVDKRVLATGDPREVLESGAYAGIREHTHVHGHMRT